MKKIFLLGLLIICIVACKEQKNIPQAMNGIIDLRNWDFEKDGIVRLDGEWEFYWKQFLKSSDFDTVKKKHYIEVPKPWNNYKWGNEELGYKGYATYRLKILVNDNKNDIGLKFPDQGTAFELFLNDSLVGKNGKIGKSRELSDPQYKPLLIPLENIGDTITLVCKVSNYDFHFGGIYFAAEISYLETLAQIQKVNYRNDYLFAGILFVMSMCLVAFYFYRKNDNVSLLFAIWTFLTFLRVLTVNERIIFELVPELSWELNIKLEALSWQLAMFFGPLAIRILFREEFSKKVLIICLALISIISLITIATPAYINSQLLIPAQIVSAMILFYLFYVYILSTIRKRLGALFILIGYIICCIGIFNELLYWNNLAPLYVRYTEVGAFYSFSWILIIAQRFSNAYKRIENFANELKKEVEEKTKDLREEKEKSDRLLLNVLPEQIAERLKAGESPIADHFDKASVVFIDIVDFTKKSAGTNPKEIVEILNALYSKLDVIAKKHGLEKIKTIGDCYMAAAGIPEPNTDYARKSADFAIEAMTELKDYDTGKGSVLNFRCGIDCGPIVAGVIGEQKFIYDIWGDMVNTASRMEMNGVVGRIQCTERFKESLTLPLHNRRGIKCESFNFEERGEIEIKGKGIMKTYFLNNI